ncbi:hypothetical protein ACJX0J_038974, partial [Zea mays]
MPFHTAGSAVGGGEDEAGRVGAEQRHAALAGVAAKRAADERGDRVALEDDEAQRAGAPEDGHRHQDAQGVVGPRGGGLAAGLHPPELHRHRDGHRRRRSASDRLPRKEASSGCGCEATDVARAPTIHEGLVVFTGARGG